MRVIGSICHRIKRMTFILPFHGGLELLIWELKDQANIYVSKMEAERDMLVMGRD